MGLSSGGFSPWKASMGRGSAKRGGGCEQLQTHSPSPGGEDEGAWSRTGGCSWVGSSEIWALPGSSQQPGEAQQCPNPSWHRIPWESPDLGATGAVGHRWVGGRAVGSRKEHIAAEVGVSIRNKIKKKKKPVAGCLIHGKKEPESETRRGNAAALH